MTPEEKALVQRIEAAFKDVVRPDEGHIMYCHKPQSDEEFEIRERMKDMEWWDIPKNILDVKNDPLSFYSVEAFWYFLPGFMIACILNPIEADILKDHLQFTLTPPDPSTELYEHNTAFIGSLKGLLTAQQREAVRDYIEWYIMRDIEDYLEEDQKKFLSIVEFWKKIAAEALPDEA